MSNNNNIKKPKMSQEDKIIGANSKLLRVKNSLSIKEVADHLNISHQQIQKYETGLNRLSGGKIHALAKLYKVPLSAFFEGIDDTKNAPIEIEKSKAFNMLYSRYRLIKSNELKKALNTVIKYLTINEVDQNIEQ